MIETNLAANAKISSTVGWLNVVLSDKGGYGTASDWTNEAISVYQSAGDDFRFLNFRPIQSALRPYIVGTSSPLGGITGLNGWVAQND